VLDAGRVVWEGRYGDLASFPGEMRTKLREWESQAAEGSSESGVRSSESLALRR